MNIRLFIAMLFIPLGMRAMEGERPSGLPRPTFAPSGPSLPDAYFRTRHTERVPRYRVSESGQLINKEPVIIRETQNIRQLDEPVYYEDSDDYSTEEDIDE